MILPRIDWTEPAIMAAHIQWLSLTVDALQPSWPHPQSVGNANLHCLLLHIRISYRLSLTLRLMLFAGEGSDGDPGGSAANAPRRGR